MTAHTWLRLAGHASDTRAERMRWRPNWQVRWLPRWMVMTTSPAMASGPADNGGRRHGADSEIHAHYQFTCATPTALSNLRPCRCCACEYPRFDMSAEAAPQAYSGADWCSMIDLPVDAAARRRNFSRSRCGFLIL